MDQMDLVSQAEFNRAVNSLEDRGDDILTAIRDLKQSMNGQFSKQGDLLSAHAARISVLEDRGSRDTGARWGAGIGTLLAIISAILGIQK